MTRLSIRCSSLDRIFKCPSSATLPKVTQPASEAAIVGTEKHDTALDDFLDDNLRGSYLKYVSSPACHYSAIEWIGAYHFKNFTLTGGADFWRITHGSTLEVIDLKTGEWEVEPTTLQLRGYALIVLNAVRMFDVKITKVKLTIHQHSVAKSITLDPEDILEFADILESRIQTGGTVDGNHCQWCECWLACSLKNNVVDKVNKNSLQTGGIEYERSRELLLAKPTVDKFYKRLRKNHLNNYSDKVKYTIRKTKEWLPDITAPLTKMSVAEAIKQGVEVEGMYKTIEKKIAKIV